MRGTEGYIGLHFDSQRHTSLNEKTNESQKGVALKIYISTYNS
jgi:hypothetical protein